jgi:hypothetical protein
MSSFLSNIPRGRIEAKHPRNTPETAKKSSGGGDLGKRIRLSRPLCGAFRERQLLLHGGGQLRDGEGFAEHRHVGSEGGFKLVAHRISGDEDDRQIEVGSRAARATSAPFMPGIA